MLLEIPMLRTRLKPIIKVNIFINGTALPVQALIDTGSSKAFFGWVQIQSLGNLQRLLLKTTEQLVGWDYIHKLTAQ